MLFSWIITALIALALGGLAGYVCAGVKIHVGWQPGHSPLARWLNDRRRTKFEQQLPDALNTMSNALRAGFSIAQAFNSVVETGDVPIGEEFKILQQQLRIGMKFEDALESLSRRVGSDDLALVTTAITISRRTGGNITEIFDQISRTIRDRQRIERKVRSLTAQGRLQGLIVSAMPLFLGIVMTLIKPKMMLPFFGSTVGILSIAVMMALIAIGWLIIRKIIRIDV